MPYNHYCSYRRSIERALTVLQTLRKREAITASYIDAIHRRRHTADIALQAEFDELRRAFITPIDREALWFLRQHTDQIAKIAEDIPLALYRRRLPCLSPDDTALLSAVINECTALHTALSALDDYPKHYTVIKHLSAADAAHRQTLKTNGTVIEEAFYRLSDACAATVCVARCVVLKMT